MRRGVGGNRKGEKFREVPVFAEVLERAVLGKRGFEQGHYGHFWKTHGEEYGQSWKGGGAITGGDHAVLAGAAGLKMTDLEGALSFQPLKNILLWLKKEVDRWMGILEMGFDLNGAGEIQGPVKEMLYELKGKAVVEVYGCEEGLEIG